MVYIHSDSERKLPHNFDAACALYGALDQGQDIRLTSFEEVASGKLDLLISKHLFVGSTDFMMEVFKRRGKSVPPLKNPFYTNSQTTLTEAIAMLSRVQSLFIKPVHQKLFTGMVFSMETISQLNWLPGNTEVYIAEPYSHPIICEERCYVHKGMIVDIRNYAGDFAVHVDVKWVQSLLNDLSGLPVAHTLDVAVLADGQQVVVELNDMWAIGNYGMENGLYFQLLKDRYFEIMEN